MRKNAAAAANDEEERKSFYAPRRRVARLVQPIEPHSVDNNTLFWAVPHTRRTLRHLSLFTLLCFALYCRQPVSVWLACYYLPQTSSLLCYTFDVYTLQRTQCN